VEVPADACHGVVAEGNCVVARRGGEQPEANVWPVGDELDSVLSRGELSGYTTKPGRNDGR